MTEADTPFDTPVFLDDETTEKVFSGENVKTFLRLLLPFLKNGERALAYVLPASGKFAHMALEPWALANLYGDAFDDIIVLIHDRSVLPFNKGMHEVACEVVRFVETDQNLVMLMGHYDAPALDNGPLRVLVQSAPSLLRDLWRHVRAGKPLRPLVLPPRLETAAASFLGEMGLGPNDRFVTLHMREQSHFALHSYHGSRNINSANYVPAALHLLEQGIWVFRLGDAGSTPLPIDHPRFIDLPFLDGYQDFMDVVLLAKAWFAICCSSGPEGPARAFGTPVLLVNAILEQQSFFSSQDVIQFKRYADAENGSPIAFPDLLERGICGFSEAGQFEERGVRLIENSPGEILAAVTEMEARLDHVFAPNTEIDQRFRSICDAFARRLESGDAVPHQIEPLDRAFGLALPWTNICQAYCQANPWFLGAPV
jgi:putative glycosyltransferase (TIGR04372 family)